MFPQAVIHHKKKKNLKPYSNLSLNIHVLLLGGEGRGDFKVVCIHFCSVS